MRIKSYKTAAYAALVLISSLSFPMAIAAAEQKQAPQALSTVDKSASASQQKVLAEKEQQIVNEAKEAVQGTQQALEALQKNDSKKAISILKTVSGQLDILLAKSPNLALIPADIEEEVSDFQGDAKTIERAIAEADNLLDSGKLQAARQILAELASEIRITTINIPLGSFPTAIKEAVARVDAGKTNDAADILANVLNMLVETTEIIPLPILHAEALLDEASDLEKKKDLSKEKSREEILKLTDRAKDKLKLGELLGYGDKDDYKALYTEIDDIKEALHTEKSASTWEKIKQALSGLKNKVTHFKK